MSKPFTYWVRLALVATLCTLVTFSPVSAGRLMDRLLHRDACKVPVNDCCEKPALCEPCGSIAPASPCIAEQASTVVDNCAPAIACDSAPPMQCDSSGVAVIHPSPVVEHNAPAMEHKAPVIEKPNPVVKQPVVEKPAPVVKKPVVEQPAPVVKQPVVEQPAPVVKQPVVEQPAPVVKQPVVEQPAPAVKQPVVEQPAPVVKQPDIVLEEPAPVIQQPTPKVESVAPPVVVEDPAPAPVKEATVPNPFDAVPTKSNDLDIFGDAPTTKNPATDPLLDPPVPAPSVEKPMLEPAVPAPAKNDLDDLFSTPAEPKATKPDSTDDIFGSDAPAKPTTPEVPPVVEPKPTKSSDSDLDDLFSAEKTEKPVAQNSSNELIGKPVNAEVELPQDNPIANANAAPDADSAFLENLFSDSSSKKALTPAPTASKAPEKAIEAQSTKIESVQPSIAPEKALPETLQPVQPKATKPSVEKELDELDALFGVSAFTPATGFQGAEYRLWVDNSGAYQVKARLAVIYSDKVKLLKENGKFSTVPLSRLSEADFGYVSWVASNLSGDQAARMVKTKANPIEQDVDR